MGLQTWIQGTPFEGSGGSGMSLCREQEPQCVSRHGLLGLGGQKQRVSRYRGRCHNEDHSE